MYCNWLVPMYNKTKQAKEEEVESTGRDITCLELENRRLPRALLEALSGHIEYHDVILYNSKTIRFRSGFNSPMRSCLFWSLNCIVFASGCIGLRCRIIFREREGVGGKSVLDV